MPLRGARGDAIREQRYVRTLLSRRMGGLIAVGGAPAHARPSPRTCRSPWSTRADPPGIPRARRPSPATWAERGSPFAAGDRPEIDAVFRGGDQAAAGVSA
ncbi:hypothetical protein J2853_000852 [Streptosporangium lutulentum]|uniref:Uncharacterized protein n=1 Tax=Streptosporangium lutulentum TaxID=1461250 RepID=A0ABT9Q5H3_9ACTN|nr:hypothetical protein [Streptosporangium lutulentum]MDP9841641.1 hypothetical protein [Streptosporangium lutulentum]